MIFVFYISGSILSDLGYSRSEDDLDESITRGRWKFRRSSPNSKEQVNQNKRRRSDNMVLYKYISSLTLQ